MMAMVLLFWGVLVTRGILRCFRCTCLGEGFHALLQSFFSSVVLERTLHDWGGDVDMVFSLGICILIMDLVIRIHGNIPVCESTS
jgi:hypothetical protein